MDAIVFDWDGTLCDSLPAIYEANRVVLEELGLPFDDDRYRAAYVPDWRLMYQRLGVADDDLETAGRRWLDLYVVAAEAGLLPRVRESLERLVQAGFVLGLVTAGDRDVVTGQLERFEIDHLIPARVFGTDDIASKPHPEPLLRVLRELDRSERIATARYVGDVPDDMRMARAVGAIGIGIESAIGGREAMLEAGASAVYPLVADFVDDLLSTSGAASMPPDRRLAVVLADGAVPTRAALDAAWPGWDGGVSIVVAADGGARNAAALGLRVDRWVGDGDSIGDAELEALAAAGTTIRRAPTAKDESDSELALTEAIEAGATEIVVLGALGGPRVDHAIANVGLLAHPTLDGRPICLFDERAARISLLAAPGLGDAAATSVERALTGRIGDLVSLVAVGDTATGVTTRGLQYPLDDEPLALGRTRGVSNVKTAAEASVTLRSGRLLVIETPVTVRP